MTTTTVKPHCIGAGCGNTAYARGLCRKHYDQERRLGILVPIEQPDRVCDLDDCENQHFACGYCQAHYTKWRRWGDPLGKPRLSEHEVARLRRDVGLPETGPTPEHRARWLTQGIP
jgi:hypothetical protein